jgi:chromosome segregation ATPase
MRSFTALCIIALVAIAAAKPAQHAKVDTRTVLAEMESSKFGSTILNFLSLNAANELPVTEVQQTVTDVLDNIQNRQADADANHASNEAYCDDQINKFNSQIATETDTVNSLTNAIASNEELLAQAKQDLNLAASDYDETITALDNGHAQREAENARWVDIDYEHTTAINAIDESVKLIKHMLHGVTFAQIKPRYEKVQETLKKSNKFSTLFKPLILGLSELATKLNYENVVHILDLLNNINHSLAQSQNEYRNNENQQAADWAALENHLQNQKASLADKKSRLNALITSTEHILHQSRVSLEFHNNSLVRATNNLHEQQAWCETVTELYTNETNERNRHTEVLNRLAENLQERWGSVAEYLQTRQSNF